MLLAILQFSSIILLTVFTQIGFARNGYMITCDHSWTQIALPFIAINMSLQNNHFCHIEPTLKILHDTGCSPS